MNLLFSSDIVKILLKTNGGRGRRPTFLGCSALCVGRLLVVACGRRSCIGPGESASFVFLAFF